MVGRLQSVSYSTIWDQFIPQARHENTAVNHALLAVATRQRAKETHPDQARQMRHQATSHYCKALRLAADGGHSLDILLLCCLLFIVYENLGYWKDRTHARSGGRLLREYRDGKLPNLKVKSLTLLNEELGPIFGDRIAHIAKATNCSRNPSSRPERPARIARKVPPSIPASFSSVSHAHTALSDLVILVLDKTLEWEEQLSSYSFEIPIIRDILNEWQDNFQRLCSKSPPTDDFYTDYRRLLWIYYRVLQIMLTATQSKNEMVFDDHKQDFEFILNTAAQVNVSQKALPNGLGLVAPWYLVATRCRDPLLRRTAVAQLRANAHRSEMMLMACPAATIASHIIWLEERGLENTVRSSDDIPQERRVKFRSANFIPTRKSLEAEFMWSNESGNEAANWVEKHVLPLAGCNRSADCAKTSLSPEVIIPIVDPSIMRIVNGYISCD